MRLLAWNALALFSLLIASAPIVSAQDAVDRDEAVSTRATSGTSCAIMDVYRDLLNREERGGCPLSGMCDDPDIRDQYTPGGGTTPLTVRVAINIFCRANGTNCLAEISGGEMGIDTLNHDFAPYGIQFVGVVRQINSSMFRMFDSEDDNPMKLQYSYDPKHYLNLYVVITGGYSYGYFPWFDDPTGPLGGVVLDITHLPTSIISHEVGHCLGLWHTHHGVTELVECSDCYELVNGDRDRTGDFCSETPATPVHFDCPGPQGADCQGTPWGVVDTPNIMGYSTPCYEHFSPQQGARMHCWIRDKLGSWVVCTGDVDGNLVVDIEDISALISNWGATGLGATGDVNQDEIVDLADLAIVLSAYGSSCL